MLHIGEQFLLRRRHLKASQAEVARLAGISRNYLSTIERGKLDHVTINTLARIATALGFQLNISLDNALYIPRFGGETSDIQIEALAT